MDESQHDGCTSEEGNLPPQNDLNTLDVVPLSEDNIHGAADVMATAFLESPVYVHVFRGDKESRHKALLWLFEINIRLMCYKDPTCLRGILHQDRVISTFFVSSQELSMWEKIKGGILKVPFKLGISTFLRLMSIIDWAEDCEAKSFSSTPKIKLERLTVLPEWQGQGLGSKCIRHCLEEAKRLNRQLVLQTQEERNVRLYSRHGMVVKAKHDFEADGNYGFESWFMSFDPLQ